MYRTLTILSGSSRPAKKNVSIACSALPRRACLRVSSLQWYFS